LSYNDGRRVGFQEVDGRVYIDVTPAGTSLGSPIGRHVILLPEDVEALQEWLAEGPRMDLVGPVPPPVAPLIYIPFQALLDITLQAPMQDPVGVTPVVPPIVLL